MRFLPLLLLILTISACGNRHDDVYLGSRDDIIINNRGIPEKQTAEKQLIEVEEIDIQKEEITEVVIESVDGTINSKDHQAKLEKTVIDEVNNNEALEQVEQEIVEGSEAAVKPMDTPTMMSPGHTKKSQDAHAQVELGQCFTKVKEGWAQILCADQMNRKNIIKIQTALKNKGYNIGAIDGYYGPQSISIMQAYQQKHQLAAVGLTIETLDHLGVEID